MIMFGISLYYLGSITRPTNRVGTGRYVSDEKDKWPINHDSGGHGCHPYDYAGSSSGFCAVLIDQDECFVKGVRNGQVFCSIYARKVPLIAD